MTVVGTTAPALVRACATPDNVDPLVDALSFFGPIGTIMLVGFTAAGGVVIRQFSKRAALMYVLVCGVITVTLGVMSWRPDLAVRIVRGAPSGAQRVATGTGC